MCDAQDTSSISGGGLGWPSAPTPSPESWPSSPPTTQYQGELRAQTNARAANAAGGEIRHRIGRLYARAEADRTRLKSLLDNLSPSLERSFALFLEAVELGVIDLQGAMQRKNERQYQQQRDTIG